MTDTSLSPPPAASTVGRLKTVDSLFEKFGSQQMTLRQQVRPFVDANAPLNKIDA